MRKLLATLAMIFVQASATAEPQDILPRSEEDLVRWAWVRPIENGYRFDREGNLVLRSSPGNIWEHEQPKGQNLLYRPFSHENAVITLRLTFVGPSIQGDQAGMMLYFGDDHYIKTVREYMKRGQTTEVLFVREQGGKGDLVRGVQSQSETVELRLVRVGELVACYYREAGEQAFSYVQKAEMPKSDAPLNLCLFATGSPSGADRDAVFHSLRVEPLKKADARIYLDAIAAEDSVRPGQDGKLTLSAADAKLTGSVQLEKRYGEPSIGYWMNPASTVQFAATGLSQGRYQIDLDHAVGGGDEPTVITLQVGDTKKQIKLSSTGGWDQFARRSLGTIDLDISADQKVRIVIVPKHKPYEAVMNFKQLVLTPVPKE